MHLYVNSLFVMEPRLIGVILCRHVRNVLKFLFIWNHEQDGNNLFGVEPRLICPYVIIHRKNVVKLLYLQLEP